MSTVNLAEFESILRPAIEAVEQTASDISKAPESIEALMALGIPGLNKVLKGLNEAIPGMKTSTKQFAESIDFARESNKKMVQRAGGEI